MERGNGWRIRAGKAAPWNPDGHGADAVVIDVDVHWQGDNGRGPDGFETVEHGYVPDVLELTFTYDRRSYRGVDVSGGAGVPGAIADVLEYGGADNVPAPELLELAELAERWHLSAMRAGCAHQGPPAMRRGRYGREVDFERTRRCPVTGYRYGSAWLVEVVPADVLERVSAIGETWGVRLGDPAPALERALEGAS